jgi:oxaloacetate decarboxylase gamma subunit
MESSIGELVLSGVKLMFIGMGIVYLFLALLVWVIGFTSRLIQRFSPEAPTHLPHPAPLGGPEENDAELVAAITAAIHSHQNKS